MSTAATRATVIGSFARPRSRASSLLLLIAIAALALNLRPAVVSVGPLTTQIREATGLSAGATGILTTLPLVCFGAFAVLAPVLGRRLGLERALLGALTLITAGVAVRLLPSVAMLYVGSAMAGMGIAIGNVLLPGVIKRDFPDRAGPVMALYAVMLNVGAALAAGLTIPVQDVLDASWRAGLGVWGLMALVAIAVWIPLARAGDRPAAVSAPRVTSMWRAPVAWSVAVFMGLQSTGFYVLSAWLPSIYRDHGIGASTSGAYLGVMNVAAIGSALVVPILAARAPQQRRLIVITAALTSTGLLGVLLSPESGTFVWMVLLGSSFGAGISIAITLFALRTRTAHQAAELSGMAQAVGYLIAACGPLGFGALRDATNGWTVPLLLLLGLCVPLVVAGWTAGRAGYVDGDGQRA